MVTGSYGVPLLGLAKSIKLLRSAFGHEWSGCLATSQQFQALRLPCKSPLKLIMVCSPLEIYLVFSSWCSGAFCV